MGGVALSTLPFSAVVGQDEAKLALLLAAVEPRLGGVLLRGDKGSAKTTLARGLAALLAPGAPFVELPLGASEDRVVGAIDVGAMLSSRSAVFRPGLLAAAHGGVLYVDEVNLLADHLVDTLLDVAVSGVNRVERDGFSEAHPARFVLIGSMNPEEGELRPQLLDRFGLAVGVRAPDDPEQRALIVTRQLAADRGEPAVTTGDHELADRLAAARPADVGDEVVAGAARLALAVGAEGLRADLSLCRAAAALAGWEGRATCDTGDLRRVAPLVLAHRRRRDPLDPPGIDQDQLDRALDDALGDPPPPPADTSGPDSSDPDSSDPDSSDPDSSGPDSRADGAPASGADPALDTGPALDTVPAPDAGPAADRASDHGPGSPDSGDGPSRSGSPDAGLPDVELRVPPPPPATRRAAPAAGGSRGGSPAPAPTGRVLGAEAMGSGPGRRVAVAATVLAAASRGADAIEPGDLRAVVAAAPRTRLVVVAVDASGSMAGRRRLDLARAAVLGLLGDAYRRRDRVAMVTFAGETAEVVLRPTGSVEVARARLAEVPTGGTTPLAAGLDAAAGVVRAAGRDPSVEPVVVLITDGRATAGGPDPLDAARRSAAALAATGARCLVLDAEEGPIRLGLAAELATALGAEHLELASLGERSVQRVIEERL